MEKIKLAYFGSPDFAADFLKKILLDKNLPVTVKLIVTQPDQLVGRKRILTPTPVKEVANNFQLPIFNFQSNLSFQNSKNEKSLKNENFKMKIKELDLVLLYAYGAMIPQELLTLPKYGFWNIHPSLLPKYRGPSPIASPLINGDKITGVTIIKMDEKIDHGPIIAQESLTIDQDDKRSDLEKKLTDLAFQMFKDIIKKVYGQDDILSLQKTTQDHVLATYTKKLTKQDGFIEISKLKDQISKNSKGLFNLFRGLTPWPGIWTILPNGKRLKIINLTMKQSNNLTIKSVQLEGKNEVNFETFNSAYKIF
ncbi:MAG TPA: methionyl-tRNA formyltransferase [Patescibacteria group bacterium]